MTDTKVTPKEYVERDGAVCPVCESNDITGGFVTIIGDGAVQDVTCQSCGSTWTDEYQLLGYFHLETGEQT